MACSLALQGQSLHDPARTLRDPDRCVDWLCRSSLFRILSGPYGILIVECWLTLQEQSLQDPVRSLWDPDCGVLTDIAGAVSSSSCQDSMGS